MTALKISGLAAAFALLVLAAFVASSPWRVHGGRFATEYLLLASPIVVVALVILALAWRFG